MKKMKKIFAMLLTLAMVLGMSMTTFAAEGLSATITVNNAEAGAVFGCVQIVKPDQTTATGWDIVDEYYDEFTKENAFYGLTEQQIINGMINAVDSAKGVAIEDFNKKYAAALNEIFATVSTTTLTNPITVYEAGIYLIKGAESDDWIYSPMAAYIAFYPYDTNKGVPTDLKDATLEAKKAPKTLTKDATSVEEINGVRDEITEIGRVETYTVESVVPFLPLTDINREYWAKDVITGAEYVLVKDGDNAGKVEVTVTVAGQEPAKYYATVGKTTDNKDGFTLDLTALLANNTHANKQITLSYQAKVTDVKVHNDVYLGDGKNDTRFGQASEDLYTGDIILTKYAEDNTADTLEDNAKLEGAEFIVYKVVEVTDEEATEGDVPVEQDVTEAYLYAKFDTNNKFVEWVDTEEAAIVIRTGADGTVKVEGLDSGTYFFKEVKAPKGYSVNTTDVSATLNLKGDVTVATDLLHANTNMLDTKLLSLPSTGGIGTTIFTVAGCMIMIAAAAMFIVSRKKEAK